MNNTCDVNVVFSFNLEDKFIDKTGFYLKECKTSLFIGLRTVKETFLSTFAENLKEIIDIVIKVFNETIEEVNERNKNLKPNIRIEKFTFEQNLKKELKNIKFNEVEKYMKLLFKDKLLFSELKKIDNLQKFWDNSWDNCEVIALKSWQKFIKNFNKFKDSPRFTSTKQAFWENKIKEIKKEEDIFTDIDDEDIYIITEYLTYINENSSNLKFSSFDKNIINSLNLVKKHLSLNFPDACCLLYKN